MSRVTKDDWRLIKLALYYAAQWEQSVVDSYQGEPEDPELRKAWAHSKALKQRFEEMRTRFMHERRGL